MLQEYIFCGYTETEKSITIVCETLSAKGKGSVICTIPVINPIEDIAEIPAGCAITIEHKRRKSKVVAFAKIE